MVLDYSNAYDMKDVYEMIMKLVEQWSDELVVNCDKLRKVLNWLYIDSPPSQCKHCVQQLVSESAFIISFCKLEGDPWT